jgi:hypothetical protein
MRTATVTSEDMVWQRQSYPTEAEARAFAGGLTYGDESPWHVETIEQCRYDEDMWDVVFAYHDDLDSDGPPYPDPEED